MSRPVADQPQGGTVDGAPSTGVAMPSAAAVAAHLEALNLAGLAFCAKRMLGKDPNPVLGQFTMWSRAGAPDLPSLTAPFWEAVSPLRIGRPSTPVAAVCDQVLVGAERDLAVARGAAADCAAAGKRQFAAAPLPDLSGDARPEAQRRAALVDAVKDFWRALGSVYGQVRGVVVQGDQQAVVRLLSARVAAVREAASAVAVMAAAVAADGDPAAAPVSGGGAAPEPVVEPVAEPAAGQLASPVDQQPPTRGPVDADGFGTTPVVAGGGALTDEQAEAFARHERLLAEEPDPEPRPVEVLSTKPVRNHPFLPIIFLLIVSGVALYVLYSLINDPTNPLAQ